MPTSPCDWPIVRQELDEIPALRKLNDELETPLIDVLVEMETNGIAIDPQMLKEQSDVLGDQDRRAAQADS